MISPFSQRAFSQGIPWATGALFTSLLLGLDNWPGQKKRVDFSEPRCSVCPSASQKARWELSSRGLGCHGCRVSVMVPPSLSRPPLQQGRDLLLWPRPHLLSTSDMSNQRPQFIKKKSPIGSERIELITISVTKPPRPPPPYQPFYCREWVASTETPVNEQRSLVHRMVKAANFRNNAQHLLLPELKTLPR